MLYSASLQNILRVKIITDPSAHPGDDPLPVICVSHDDLAALSVVVANAHLVDVIGTLDTQILVDLKLDGKAMAIPTKAPLYMETLEKYINKS